MCEIPVTDVGPVRIGQTENAEAATGCTVFIAPDACGPDWTSAEVVSESITRAVTGASGAYGYPAARDLKK